MHTLLASVPSPDGYKWKSSGLTLTGNTSQHTELKDRTMQGERGVAEDAISISAETDIQ